jgi:anti-sigma B factor antagonist
MKLLGIRSEGHVGAAVLALEGEFDLAQVSAVEQALATVERDRPAIMVIDLSGVTFLDSSGLRVILEADGRARRAARRLVLVRGPEQVHRVFLIALLDKRLEFVDDPTAVGGAGGR